MPIQISCQCGKTLKVKDELAGKAVKCPGCGKPIRVGQSKPSAPQKQKQAQAQAPAAAVAAPLQAPVQASADAAMDDLFDEAGFSEHVAAVCPNCRAEMSATAVLCVKCGYNKETGENFESHKTAGVDIDAGTMALDKAEADLDEADRIQKEMLSKAGMPWWMLALIIFMLASGTTIAVLAVNAANQVDTELTFKPMQLFLNLIGGAFALAGGGALIKLGVAFAKGEAKKSTIIKLGIAAVVLSGIAITMLVMASRQ